jgi:inhibitor of cysteine peptidase
MGKENSKMKAIYLVLLLAALSACSPAVAQPNDSTPGPQFVIEPIEIDQVEIRIMESFPVQVSAHVTGMVGDGCATCHGVEQARQGNFITLTIERQREQANACTMIAKLYDKTIRPQSFHPARAV